MSSKLKIVPLWLVMILLSQSLFAKKYELSLKLEPGVEYKHMSKADMNIEQEVMGQAMNIHMEILGAMVFRVEEVQETSYDLKAWYADMQMSMSITMGDMDLSEAMGQLDQIMESMLDSMVHIPFKVRLSNKGKVLEVSGMEKVWERAMSQFSELPEDQRKQIRQQINSSYGDKALAGNIEMVTAIFPEKTVKPGDSWQVETMLNSGFRARVLSTFELAEAGKDQFLIKGLSTMATLEEDGWVESNGMKVKYMLEGEMQSEIKLDPQSCWIIESNILQDMEGNAKMQESAQFPEGMNLPMKVHNETTISSE